MRTAVLCRSLCLTVIRVCPVVSLIVTTAVIWQSLNFGYNGSERFYKNERWGFFPAAGLAWVISNEKFWRPMNKVIPKLKLKATYGLVGNDAIGDENDRFFYLSR